MPYVNPARVLRSPHLATKVLVRRRAEKVNSKGRGELAVTEHKDVCAVVNAASPNDLERLPNYDSAKRYISVITDFPMRLSSVGFKADAVVWAGDEFLTETLDPYPQYGRGFVQCICGSMDTMDRPMPARGAEDFDDASESGLAGVR